MDQLESTPKDLLEKFYRDNNLGEEGGNGSSSVKIEISSKFSFYFPNFDARRRAVIKHDIHHLLTRYKTTIKGESEISAWEIGSGCKKYWAATLINTSGVMIGIPINPRAVLRAFSRGRRTKNLYHELFSNEEAMNMKIGDLREQLLLDEHPIETKPTMKDFLFFIAFLIFGGIYSIMSLFLLPFIFIYSIYIAFNEKKKARLA